MLEERQQDHQMAMRDSKSPAQKKKYFSRFHLVESFEPSMESNIFSKTWVDSPFVIRSWAAEDLFCGFLLFPSFFCSFSENSFIIFLR
jgi:hypothetical protein